MAFAIVAAVSRCKYNADGVDHLAIVVVRVSWVRYNDPGQVALLRSWVSRSLTCAVTFSSLEVIDLLTTAPPRALNHSSVVDIYGRDLEIFRHSLREEFIVRWLTYFECSHCAFPFRLLQDEKIAGQTFDCMFEGARFFSYIGIAAVATALVVNVLIIGHLFLRHGRDDAEVTPR